MPLPPSPPSQRCNLSPLCLAVAKLVSPNHRILLALLLPRKKNKNKEIWKERGTTSKRKKRNEKEER
jgi:hypothetical protein